MKNNSERQYINYAKIPKFFTLPNISSASVGVSMPILSYYLLGATLLSRGSCTVVPAQINEVIGYSISVGLGTPQQNLQLSLIFSTDVNCIIPSESCPPFVTCFSRMQSSTFREVNPGTIQSDASIAVDSLRLGDAILDQSVFAYTDRLDAASAQSQNTAGVLSLSPYSDIGKSSLLVVSEAQVENSQTGLRMGLGIQVVRTQAERSSYGMEEGVAFPLNTGAIGWTITGRMELNSNDVFGREVPIIIEPSREGILIPLEWIRPLISSLELITETFHIENSGRLMLPCGADNKLSVTFNLHITAPNGRKVPIHLSNNLGAREYNEGAKSFLCRTDITLSRSVRMIIMGHTVLKQRRSVILDGIASRVIFSSSESPVVAARPILRGPPIHRIPGFHFHEILPPAIEGGVFKIQFRGQVISRTRMDNGYMLKSSRPYRGNGGELAYGFVRVIPQSRPTVKLSLPGIYCLLPTGDSSLEIDTDSLLVSLSLVEATTFPMRATAYQIIIEESPSSMTLKLVPYRIRDVHETP